MQDTFNPLPFAQAAAQEAEKTEIPAKTPQGE